MAGDKITETKCGIPNLTIVNTPHVIIRVLIDDNDWIQLEKMNREALTCDWRIKTFRLSKEQFAQIADFLIKEKIYEFNKKD